MSLFLKFVGKKISFLISAGIIVGIIFFFVELAFARLIQVLLIKLGFVGTLTSKDLDFYSLELVLIALFIAGVLRASLQWLQNNLTYGTWAVFADKIRNEILNWVYRSPQPNTNVAVTMFTERTQDATISVAEIQSCTFHSFVTLGLLSYLMYLLPLPTLIALFLLSILYIPIKILNRRVQSLGQSLINFWNSVNSRMILGLKNILLLRLYNLQDNELKQASLNLKSYTKDYIKSYSAIGLASAIPQVFGVFVLCVIIYMQNKEIDKSNILISYIYIFYRFIQSAAQASHAFTRASSYWPRFSDLMSWWNNNNVSKGAPNSPITNNFPTNQKVEYTKIGWNIEGIKFGFSKDSNVISNLSLTIPANSAIAIKGESGSGKTTLLNLLLGLIKPDNGTVLALCDEDALAPFDNRDKLLPQIGYVGPESFLISGTILENLKYGSNRDFSQSEALNALKLAKCDFLMNRPDPLNYFISEQGQGLSSGQKQRVTLAKALLRQPRALVLDEATANLDQQTELEILETLKALKGKMTLIIVTHRDVLTNIADQTITLK